MTNLNQCPVLMTEASPTVTPVIPALAKAIGLHQSIILVQIAHWIKTASGDVYHDDKWWTYQSLSDMQEKAFEYWDRSTISRGINSLVKQGYIFKGNYNKRKSDKTQWFALNVEKLSELECLEFTFTKKVLQNATASKKAVAERNSKLQNATPILQNATTLPESPSESPSESSSDDDEKIIPLLPAKVPEPQPDQTTMQKAHNAPSTDQGKKQEITGLYLDLFKKKHITPRIANEVDELAEYPLGAVREAFKRAEGRGVYSINYLIETIDDLLNTDFEALNKPAKPKSRVGIQPDYFEDYVQPDFNDHFGLKPIAESDTDEDDQTQDDAA